MQNYLTRKLEVRMVTITFQMGKEKVLSNL